KNVRLFVLHGESLVNIQHKNLDIVFGNIVNKNDVKKAMRDVDTVYHLAAFTTGKDDPKFEVNWIGTRNLLEYCKSPKFRKFILFSSIAIYGLPSLFVITVTLMRKVL